MHFTPASLQGAHIIDLQPIQDNRGFFSRGFCQREFAEHGLKGEFVQCNVSWNEQAGTLRGMHFQRAPHAEVKFIRCTRGALFDVIIDLRPGSPTYCKYAGVELTAENRRALYVPEGFAHGFQTLVPQTEAFYMVSEFYTPSHEGAVRWDDPVFGIEWPLPDPILSPKDAAHPDFLPEQRGA